MHEHHLMVDLVRKVEAVARAQGARRVVSVSVRLGALSHMSPAHFREHFRVAAEGTIAAGAALDARLLGDVHDPHAQDVLLESVEVES